jgi:GT2 family glycosyltransferase
METLAPPVVAVVVAHDPGPWFEETLASLKSQDYSELSVLVLDVASAEDLTARVGAVLPTGYVRRFEENRGFGATVNEALQMVDGADYFLLCHDDVALSPDTVHLLVEEAFRSNAGIVSSKVVSWDNPDRLVHVGMTVDKGGSVVDRLQSGEIDHGQHDAVRDVFVAPGGVTLVRADLLKELGGFDPAIVAMGEDLDLCWRAQVAGARIIVAPDARVRHLEELASGSRPVERSLRASTDSAEDTDKAEEKAERAKDAADERTPTLQELQRRHELLAVLKCYSPSHLARVLPQIFVLAVGEVIVASLAGNRARARAVVGAWRWNLGRIGTIRRQRKELKGHRRLSDKEIRLLQLGGIARVSAYGRRVFQHGFHGAHADEISAAEDGPNDGAGLAVPIAAGVAAGVGAPLSTPGSLGATSQTAAAAEVPAGTAAPVVASGRGRLDGTTKLIAWLVAALVVVIGTRDVIAGRLPVVGQFAPFPGWTATFGQFFSGWHPSGVGTTAPASPALALVGILGTVFIGAMGLTQKVIIFGCIPLGVWGVVRLVRPFGSQRASLIAGISYLAMALPYNALALGRLQALVIYAGGPWALARLFRASRSAPYGDEQSIGPNPVPRVSFREVLALGLLEAVLVSFVPAAAIVLVVSALALFVCSPIFGEWRASLRALRVAFWSTLVAGVICLPWLIGVLSAGRGALNVFGVPIPASEAASWGSILRFSVGPIGVSPLAWGFAVAALVPLVLARGQRFRWAGRFWTVALVFWLLTWIVGRGWTGALAIDPLVLLAPAAVCVAAGIGLGVVAFEEDLPSAQFGWRQLVTVVASAAFVLGVIPTFVSALPGRWNLPVNDFSQSVTWMSAKASSGAFRVLWLGDARALNQGSWNAGDGIAYATSENGGPDARWLWNAPAPGPTATLASAVNLARSGRTDRLGRMLAPAGVRYVVLLTSLAPEIDGEQTPQQYPVPADLAPALSRQLDLTPIVSGTGITVYGNAAWIPQRAEIGGVRSPVRPVLLGQAAVTSFTGPLATGTVLSATAPAGSWNLTEATGVQATRSTSFGWAARFRVTQKGVGTLAFDGGLITPLSAIGSIIFWVVAIVVLVRTRRRHRGSGPSWREAVQVGRPRSASADLVDWTGDDPFDDDQRSSFVAI